MPVPNYLKNNSINIEEKGGYTKFNFVCHCRNKSFFLFKNALTKNEKAALQPYFDFLSLWCCSDLPKEMNEDENGKTHYYMQRNYPDTEWTEVICPECPIFWGITVVKAKCSCCGKEFVLFDSRYHGYDAKYFNNLIQEEADYVPSMKQIRNKTNTPVQLQIKFRYVPTYDMFISYSDNSASPEDYENSFLQMWIYSIGENGKKRTAFEVTTS